MTPVNRDKITKLVSQIKESRGKLEEAAKMTKEEFLKDAKTIDAIKYDLVIGVEAMLDLCNHIIAQEKLGLPIDYADVFKVVNKLKIFTEELGTQLIDTAKYRNKLVHLYLEIDDDKVYDQLKGNIKTFELFEDSIAGYLKKIKK